MVACMPKENEGANIVSGFIQIRIHIVRPIGVNYVN